MYASVKCEKLNYSFLIITTCTYTIHKYVHLYAVNNTKEYLKEKETTPKEFFLLIRQVVILTIFQVFEYSIPFKCWEIIVCRETAATVMLSIRKYLQCKYTSNFMGE